MTDITGFGLVGHAIEVAKASGISIEIDLRKLPLLPGALEYSREGFCAGGLTNNREFFSKNHYIHDSIPPDQQNILFDPQTSGGLLIFSDPQDTDRLLESLRAAGVDAGEVGSAARRFLENPTIAGERRRRLLKEIFDALNLERRVANFIGILVDRDRLPILEEIIKAYQKLLDERLGIVRARVTSAYLLDHSEQQRLAARLEQATGKQIRMEVTVDPSLIGGVVAQVGSTIYDGSVRQQLEAFKTRLVEE